MVDWEKGGSIVFFVIHDVAVVVFTRANNQSQSSSFDIEFEKKAERIRSVTVHDRSVGKSQNASIVNGNSWCSFFLTQKAQMKCHCHR